jgi:tetratricopeptide (TPR) repeat protein
VESRNPTWYLLASKAYDGLDDVNAAVRNAQIALDLNPRTEQTHLQLAQIFLSRNTPEAAFSILDDAKVLFPDTVLIRLGLGLALRDMRRYEEAAAMLQDVLRSKPNLSTAFDALGSVYLNAARYDDLIASAAAYAENNPDDYRGYFFQAAGKEKSGSATHEVEKLLRRSLQLNPNFAPGYALRGKILLDAGDVPSATRDLETAIRLRPDYTPAHVQLIRAYKRAGRVEEASREITELARLNEEAGKPVPRLLYHRGPAGAAHQ